MAANLISRSWSHLNIQLSASVICMNLVQLDKVISDLIALGVHRLHVDFIDNAFGGLGLPREILRDLRNRFSLPIDVHLMIACPERAIEWLVADGADCICVHQASLTSDLVDQLAVARLTGVEIGLVLNPGELAQESAIYQTGATRLTAMSVIPGGAGRSYDSRALTTLRHARSLVGRTPIKKIEIDGAVGPVTLPEMLEAGAEIFVIGSTVIPTRSIDGNRLKALWQSARNPAIHARQLQIRRHETLPKPDLAEQHTSDLCGIKKGGISDINAH